MIDVHATVAATVIAYNRILFANRHAVSRAFISEGRIDCELHDGVVIHADSPEELERRMSE